MLGAAEDGPMEADELAERLLARGHTVTVRTALGGGGGGECLRNLRHVFLSVGVQARPPTAPPPCNPFFRLTTARTVNKAGQCDSAVSTTPALQRCVTHCRAHQVFV